MPAHRFGEATSGLEYSVHSAAIGRTVAQHQSARACQGHFSVPYVFVDILSTYSITLEDMLKFSL